MTEKDQSASAEEQVKAEMIDEVDASTITEDTSELEPVVSELDDLRQQLEQMEDKFLRASAEIANITSRNRNEREALQKYRSQDLGKKILPAIDNLERAMAIEVQDEQSQSLKKGIEMVLESLHHALKEEGIEEIPAKDQSFDPTLHQAVHTVEATEGQTTDTIVEVFQKGYKLHDRVLRPSMVVVAQ